MSWRGALLFCLGCSFDPAGLEGRPGPCLDGYTEIDGRCYTPDVGAGDSGTPDVDVPPDVQGMSDVPDTEPMIVVDAFTPDVVAAPDVAGCFCGMTGLSGCEPCADGEHRSCRDGEVVTGSSCVDANIVATCNGDEEVFGECAAGCGENNGWGCDFAPSFVTPVARFRSVLQGSELRIDSRRRTVELDGEPVTEGVTSVDANVVLYVSAIDVETIVVDGPGGVGIRASDTIRIREGVDLGARGPVPGPGGSAMGSPRPDPCGGLGAEGEGEGGGGPSGTYDGGGAGGGGGGFGSRGGNGGTRGTVCSGYSEGGGANSVRFVGGSAGGGSEGARGGGGGGALYFSARVAIFLDGVLEAGGGGGGPGGETSGAGGGAGGLLYFEAPIVATEGVELRANGGGGGSGARAGVSGEDGEDGRVAETRARGGGGLGAPGGDGSGPMGVASDGSGGFLRIAGGGGGGAGWIIIRTGDGEPVPEVQTSPVMSSPSAQWLRLP
ncbi:MAG: hypothetical protein AB8H86_12030 [Polyangiales bacterium]